jgi:signal transduction histidine kinase
VRTVLQVPMVFGNQVVGLYTVRFDHERSFGPEDLQLAKALALQATLAIRLTQLGEQARQAAVAAEGERVARDKAIELDAVNAALRAEVVERRRAEKLARAHSSVITGTLRSLTVEPKLDVFIGQVLKAIADELRAVSAVFWIRDPATDLMHLQFNYERGELTRQAAAQEPWQLPRSAPVVDASRTDPEVIIYSDADIDNSPALAPLRQYFRANGIRRVLAVRLFFAGQSFGTYAVRFLSPEPLADDQINLARALAQEATLAIALARLEAQAREAATATERERAARERATELAKSNAVLQSSLQVLASQPRQELFLAHALETLGTTLDAHSCALWRLSPDNVWLALAVSRGRLMGSDEVSASPLARAFAQAVAVEPALLQLMARPTAFVIEDLTATDLFAGAVKTELLRLGARSLVSVAMRIGEQVLGRFEVRLDRTGGLPPYGMEILEALANQVALALHMTRLAEESRQAAVFAERNRLARDIHDTLAQGFTGVIVQLEAAMDAIGHRRRRESDRHIERAAELARHSLAEARRSVHALRPLALEGGGVGSALERLLFTMTAGTGIDAQCHTSGAVRKLPPEWEENLLRIGQEALANALKHGTPRNICVELRFDAEEIDLSLRDDGTGFDPAAPTSGMGLTGMRERAARLGWRLDVRSRLGEGSEVFVSLRPPG